MSEFSGKTVLITGAGRGIGRQTALSFGAEGANVCVNYASSATDAESAVDAIVASGGSAFAYQADISNSSEVESMVKLQAIIWGISIHFLRMAVALLLVAGEMMGTVLTLAM